jgi:GTP-binding protein
VELELKLMADVGLVGFPNAGKSTLISRISRAHPKIADYPFTTLEPSLGVVQTEAFETFVVADIPGLIAGAHLGTGLGLRFLRHVERTAMLLLLLDCSLPPQEALAQHASLLEEMGHYSPGLLERRRAVALTKLDLKPPAEHLASLRTALEGQGEQVWAISAVSGEGLDGLLTFLAGEVRLLRKERPVNPAERSSPSTPRS